MAKSQQYVYFLNVITNVHQVYFRYRLHWRKIATNEGIFKSLRWLYSKCPRMHFLSETSWEVKNSKYKSFEKLNKWETIKNIELHYFAKRRVIRRTGEIKRHLTYLTCSVVSEHVWTPQVHDTLCCFSTAEPETVTFKSFKCLLSK